MMLVNEIDDLNPVYNKWYMDDGGIVGPVDTLLKVWDLIKRRGPELGLHLNPAKCEWSWLDPDCTKPCPIRLEGASECDQVKLVPHSEIQMLGVPLGNDGFVADFVEKKLLGRLQTTINQLVDFEDTQSAFYLLRVSFSIVRSVHFMRTTPLRQWEAQAAKFDTMVHDAAVQILGFPMSSYTFAQAALTPKLGGLGLRKTVEHATGAFSASWHESQKQSGETWLRPPEVKEYKPQKQASFEFDEQMLRHLIDKAPNEREVQRLSRAAQPHASGFITAVPSEEDGNDTILRPRNFRVAVAYRLGVPVLNDNILCPLCTQTIDKLGDHATCCTKSGDLIVRHNCMRNFIQRIATDGVLSPVLEKKGILGPTSGRRPGDVTIPIWIPGKALAIDVAVTCPFVPSQVRLTSPCDHYAAAQKHKKYDASFEGQPYLFAAVVFETTGAINEEGVGVLRQLFRFAAKHLGVEFSSYCGRAWARLSCNLQRAVSQSILSRIDGATSVVPALKLRDSGLSTAFSASFEANASPDLTSVVDQNLGKITSPLNPRVQPFSPTPQKLLSPSPNTTLVVTPKSVKYVSPSPRSSDLGSFGRIPQLFPQETKSLGTPQRLLSPPPKNSLVLTPKPPFHPSAPSVKFVSTPRKDLGSSSFGHTGLSPFFLSDWYNRRASGVGANKCVCGVLFLLLF